MESELKTCPFCWGEGEYSVAITTNDKSNVRDEKLSNSKVLIETRPLENVDPLYVRGRGKPND